jgi:hypothetical protein
LIETKVKEYHRHIYLFNPEKSALSEDSIDLGYHIQLQNTVIVAKRTRQMEWISRKAIEIELHLDNMNREDGFSLS